MGYNIKQLDHKFYIFADNKQRALEAVKHLKSSKTTGFSWVSGAYKEADSLDEALDDWGWNIQVDPISEDVTGIIFEGDKAGDDLLMLEAIAPFVSDGSYIEMCGEDGEHWRWFFKGGRCIEIHPDVSWNEF